MFEMRPYRRNSMSAWNPFSEMEEMERRLFNNDFFSGRGLAEFKTDITDDGMNAPAVTGRTRRRIASSG